MKAKFPAPTESQEQIALFSWADLQSGAIPELRLLHHIPNGGSRTRSEGARFKAEGVRAGVPDLFLPVARDGFHGLYIEIKRTEGGKLSATQRTWIDALTAQGYRVAVCYGWQEAHKTIMEYLKS